MDERITSEVALVHENALDNWRNQLPEMYYFQITVNGTVNLDEIRATNQRNTETKFDKKDIILFEKKILLLFYFLAKSMIHLPVIATKPFA
ncbi:CGH_1_HP_G0099340.mRNA.1.CDS.1 [Saccharomyces cerevisiae]|nr:CGH_1_HP_G0099340.mRNA.1.CDS.1 [Saccharomyces cerevisiae]CAI6946122.1 CGH_1_HP_G0099340.mRNA.1.CDS.1 [Saccharomyces cerevisiae]